MDREGNYLFLKVIINSSTHVYCTTTCAPSVYCHLAPIDPRTPPNCSHCIETLSHAYGSPSSHQSPREILLPVVEWPQTAQMMSGLVAVSSSSSSRLLVAVTHISELVAVRISLRVRHDQRNGGNTSSSHFTGLSVSWQQQQQNHNTKSKQDEVIRYDAMITMATRVMMAMGNDDVPLGRRLVFCRLNFISWLARNGRVCVSHWISTVDDKHSRQQRQQSQLGP